jgi:signal recognition particle GTPase
VQKIKQPKSCSKINRQARKIAQILKGEGRITEINVAETLKEVRRALLDADVNYKREGITEM